MVTQGIKSIAGGFYGIDETNVLVADVTKREYIATEDCYCTFTTNYNSETAIKINGVQISGRSNKQGKYMTIWLKSGQRLTLEEYNGTKANLTGLYVFGLKQ